MGFSPLNRPQNEGGADMFSVLRGYSHPRDGLQDGGRSKVKEVAADYRQGQIGTRTNSRLLKGNI